MAGFAPPGKQARGGAIGWRTANASPSRSCRLPFVGTTSTKLKTQIAITRETPGASGRVLFNMQALMANRRGLVARLSEEVYPSEIDEDISPAVC
jgi:hypothetical protein